NLAPPTSLDSGGAVDRTLAGINRYARRPIGVSRTMSVVDEANAAFDSGDLNRVRALLEPGASAGDLNAQATLGTMLSLSPDRTTFIEGVGWLRAAANCGHGHAAHNLATILAS